MRNIERKYISDSLSRNGFRAGQFNIIASGTGTGKTQFIRKRLLELFPEVLPQQVLFVTSRSLIRDQQSLNPEICKFTSDELQRVRYWHNEIDVANSGNNEILVMNYNQFIYILEYYMPFVGGDVYPFKNIRIAVFDECHALLMDYFVEKLSLVRYWINEQMFTRKILIGLTATPELLFDQKRTLLHGCVQVNDEFITSYKAKNLICMRVEDLEQYIRENVKENKMIVMCNSMKDMCKLHKKFVESEMLCSRSQRIYDDRMEALRSYIVENNRLPEESSVLGDARPHRVQILFTTSTMREGINLYPESGINTVISCLSDDVNVKQFLGRCRYDVENLVVVHNTFNITGVAHIEHIRQSACDFYEYIRNPESRKWYDSMSDVIGCRFEDIRRYNLDSRQHPVFDEIRSLYEVNDENQLVVPKSQAGKLIGFFRENELLEDNTYYTFNAVRNYMTSRLGYTVKVDKRYLDGKTETYYLFSKENEDGYQEDVGTD